MKDVRAVAFVHAVTAVLCLATGWYVVTQGSTTPIMDEWDLLGEWRKIGDTGEWAMQAHNEHRFPVAKLLCLGALKLTGFDFKPPLFLTLALMSAAAVLLVWTARGVRGYQHPADIILPALLLHWGHGYNFLSLFQVVFAIVVYGAAGWLWCANRIARGGGYGWVLGSLGYALLIVPSSGYGLTFGPAVVMWCGWCAWREWANGRRLKAIIPLAAGLLSAGYWGWVYAHMPNPTLPVTSPFADPVKFLGAAAASVSVGVGLWAAPAFWSLALLFGTVAAAYLLATRILVRRWFREPECRPITLALLAVFLGTAATAAGTAYARGVGFTDRMGFGSAVGLAALWIVLSWRTPPARSRSVLAWLGVLLAGGIFLANYTPGMATAIQIRHSTWALRRDLRAGVPPMILASRHGHAYSVLVGPRMAEHVVLFRNAKMTDFANVPDDPPFVAVPFSQFPQVLHAEAEAPLPDPPAKAWAVRLHARTPKDMSRERVLLRWTDAATGTDHEDEARPSPAVGDSFLIFPLSGRPTRLRMIPGEGIPELRITAAEWLLTPP